MLWFAHTAGRTFRFTEAPRALEFHAGNDQAPEPQSSSNKSNPGPTTPQTGYADATRMGQTAETEHSSRALQARNAHIMCKLKNLIELIKLKLNI